MKVFENTAVIVTGAGSGIGRATALRFANDGARVAVVGLNTTTADATVEWIRSAGGTADAIGCHVPRSESIRETIAKVVTDHGY